LSDVFDKILEKLKQKAEPAGNIAFKTIKAFEKEKWVRFEDIESAIQQIKQDYVLVSKEWLNKRLEEEWQRTRLIDASDLPQAIGKIDLILEILEREGRGC